MVKREIIWTKEKHAEYQKEYYHKRKGEAKFKAMRTKASLKWNKANRDKINAYHNNWARKNRKKTREYYKQWKATNFETVCGYQKKYRDAHKEKISAYGKMWYQKNKDKIKKDNKNGKK